MRQQSHVSRSTTHSLNLIALLGWMYGFTLFLFVSSYEGLIEFGIPLTLALESICILEVCRILIGYQKGNALFGVLLHSIRLIMLLLVIPDLDEDDGWLTTTILVTYAVTEISRYPMYLFKKNKDARTLRMVVPVFTFPIGCTSEAYAAWRILWNRHNPLWAVLLLVWVLVINGILGPYMAYPHVLKKAFKSVKKFEKKKKKEERKEKEKEKKSKKRR